MKLGCFNIRAPSWKAVRLIVFFVPFACLIIVAGILYVISFSAISMWECVDYVGDWVCEIWL